MGNAQGAAGSIIVHTDKPGYVAGEVVTGVVYVNLIQPIQSEGVYLRLRGEEQTWFRRQVPRREEHHHHHHHHNDNHHNHHHHGGNHEGGFEDREFRGRVVFFQRDFLVMGASAGNLLPGQYQIPFQFQLPVDLPGVFNDTGRGTWSSNGDHWARILYEVKAWVSTPRGGFLGLTSGPSISSTQLLTVNTNIQQLLMPESVEATRSICLLCCIPRGKVWLRAHMSKTSFFPGETAHIVLEVSNTSTSTIRSITVELKRRLELRAHGSHAVHHHDYGHGGPWTDEALWDECRYSGGANESHVDVQRVCRAMFAGVDPGTQCVGDMARSVPLTLSWQDGRVLEPETTGRIIRCSYQLDILVNVAWAPDVGLSIPVHIYAPVTLPPAGVQYQLPEPPQGWNPTVFSTFVIPSLG